MGPRTINQPSFIVRFGGFASVLVCMIVIYYLVGDYDESAAANNVRGGEHESDDFSNLQPIINHHSSNSYSYFCSTRGNLAYTPSTRPLMGLYWPLPKYVHQADHLDSHPIRLFLPQNFTMSLKIDNEVGGAQQECIEGSVKQFCFEEPSLSLPFSHKADDFFTVDHVQMVVSSKLLLESLQHTWITKKFYRYMRSNESYMVFVHPNHTAVLLAHNELSMLYALNSLSQMLHSPMTVQLPVEILDWPENNWRGLLVDVSRHFQPLPTLFKVIDGMATSKLNKLHLHLTDAASFPVLLKQVSPDAPFDLSNLISKDAVNFALNKFYTIEQLHRLVRYAKLKGIEVIPEIDMPAHSLSWKHVFPNIIINCSEVANTSPTPENIYALDISNERVYEVIAAILQQIVEIFPSSYLHIGGDEVEEKCYLSSPRVLSWAAKHNISTNLLTKYFETRVFNMVYKLHKIPIVWQGIVDNKQLPEYASSYAKPSMTRRRLQIIDEVYQSNLDQHYVEAAVSSDNTVNPGEHKEKAVIMPWKCWSGMALKASQTALQRQHPIIMSACWYLDINDDWTSYLHNPSLDMAKFNANMSLIYGGEGSLWTEKADHTSSQCRIYPRLGAIAYRLWGVGSTLCPASYMNSFGNNLYAIYNSLHHNYFVTSDSNALHNALTMKCIVRPNTSSSDVQLGLFATQILYSAYATYHAYLTTRLHIRAHNFVFHLKTVRNTEYKTVEGYVPYVSRSLHNSMRLIEAMRSGIVIPKGWSLSTRSKLFTHLKSHSYNINYQLEDIFQADNFSMRYSLYPPQSLSLDIMNDGTNLNTNYSNLDYMFGNPIYITSQCSNILQSTNRPLVTPSVKVLSYNIFNGNAASLSLLTKYLHGLVNDGLLMATLVEANQWDTLSSVSDMVKNVNSIIEKASLMGLAYSYVPHSKAFNGYPVGIVSSIPFDVLDVQGSPAFERGYVFIRYPSLDLHIVALHLHAHNATLRSLEVRQIVRRVLKPLLDEGKKVLVMGDFNTLSPIDRMEHERIKLVETIKSQNHPNLKMWRDKFLGLGQGEVDYKPMHLFLRAGLRDVCVDYCCQAAHIEHCEDMVWSTPANTPPVANANSSAVDDVVSAGTNTTGHLNKQAVFSLCMAERCGASIPTKFSPEWTMPDLRSPSVRVDFILASPGVYNHTSNVLMAGVAPSVNNVTDTLSDHYPMYLEYRDAQDRDVEFFR